MHQDAPRPLSRRLGLLDAVTIGLGSMLGAGVFVAFGPATAAAGPLLPAALLLAAAIAWANASSSARLAALMPTSGGAYAYGRLRLSPAVGTVAGAAFLIGKTISAGAIAGAVGAYLWPAQGRLAAAAVVVVLTAAACAGVRRGALMTRWVVGLVLVTLGLVVAAAALAPTADGDLLGGPLPAAPVAGVLEGAGVLFFAFAGYARIATLGEEVRDPARTLPRAIAIALGAVLVTYGAVGVTLVRTLGAEGLADSVRPVADAARVGLPGGVVAAVAAVAALAAAASGLGVLLGLSRTTLAMARDGVLPRVLARLDGPADEPRPVLAQVVLGALVVLGVLLLDVPRAIMASSAAVLVYYAVAHVAALTLAERRWVPALGLAGCLTVAVALVVALV